MIVDSGRGFHLYWKIKDAPIGALKTWQVLEDYLYKKLKEFGADPRATDAVRVLRLPGTINTKNGRECKIVYSDDKLEELAKENQALREENHHSSQKQ